MKTIALYFFRHGIAVNRGDPGITSDSDRPLTEEGARKTRVVREFDKMASLYNFRVVDVTPSIEEVFAEVKNAVEPLLHLPHLPSRASSPPLP